MVKVRSGWNHIQCVVGEVVLHIGKATPITLHYGMAWKGFLINTAFIDETDGTALVYPLASEHDKIIGSVPWLHTHHEAITALAPTISPSINGRLQSIRFQLMTIAGATRKVIYSILDEDKLTIYKNVSKFSQSPSTTWIWNYGDGGSLSVNTSAGTEVTNTMQKITLAKNYTIKFEAYPSIAGDEFSAFSLGFCNR